MTLSQRISTLLISLTLAACGGGGNSGGASAPPVPPTVPPVAQTKNVLFVADRGSSGFLAASTTLTPAAGAFVANILANSGQSFGKGMAYDTARDRLYGLAGKDVSVFDNASALNGNITRTRFFTPILSGASGGGMYGMFLDKDHDRMYIGYGDGLQYSLAVLDNVSAAKGDVVPNRTIFGLHGNFAIDTQRSVLYTTSFSSFNTPTVYAYPNVDKFNGSLQDATSLKLPAPIDYGSGLAVDAARDRLYVSTPSQGVTVITDASTILKNTAGAGNVKLAKLPVASQLGNGAAAFDPNNDRLYVALDNNVYVISTASQLGATTTSNAVMVSAPSGSVINAFAF
ncbi:hypothetical protein [Duganella sp. LjRoot269]|jgi:hypothetical protein|uniref:hypothetical protein n=1 Tax=Duganella sp. LjRoot269 TaxID=3342305 RepID=UPI00159E2A20